VQALVCATPLASPRRTITGLNQNRISLLLAVLEKRVGLHFSDMDVFANVVGGFRLDEPAADLAAALALVSSLREMPLPSNLAAFGEMGLAGETRAVDMARQRVSEASKFGFTRCIIPRSCMADIDCEGMDILPVSGVGQAIEWALEG
jgi:DNA repair protein RadA/Sms